MTSVIIITYNRAEMLKRAIKSVLEQTVQHWELIIVDDGSDDGTEEIVGNFNDQRIRYIKKGHTGNLSFLRNTGIAEAKCEYIAFLDSDDEWKPQKLEEQIGALDQYPGAGFCFCDVNVIENGQMKHNGSFKLKEKIAYGMFGKDYLKDHFIFFPSALIFRKEILHTVGVFDETLEAGDHDFMARLAIQCNGLLLEVPLVIIHRHIKNHSDEDKLMPVQSYLYTLQKLKKQQMISYLFYYSCRSFIFYKKGIYLKRTNQKGASRLAFLQSFIAWPFHIKSLFRFFRG